MSHRFRLGVVLRLREMAEEAARIDLGHAIAAHQGSLSAVEAEERGLGDDIRYVSALQKKQTAAGDLAAGFDAVDVAQRRLVDARERLARTSDSLFQARRRLADATRRREVVERLRDRFIAAERREMDRLDAITASEITSTRHAIRIAGERR